MLLRNGAPARTLLGMDDHHPTTKQSSLIVAPVLCTPVIYKALLLSQHWPPRHPHQVRRYPKLVLAAAFASTFSTVTPYQSAYKVSRIPPRPHFISTLPTAHHHITENGARREGIQLVEHRRRRDDEHGELRCGGAARLTPVRGHHPRPAA